MNKSEQALSLIGDDPRLWSRVSPLPPSLPWLQEEIERIVRTVAQVVSDDRRKAEDSLAGARDRDDAMRSWYRIAIWVGTARANRLDRTSGLERVDRSKQDKKLRAIGKRSLFVRDGYRCRYCGQRVISEEILVALGSTLSEGGFSARGDDTSRRGASLVFRAVEDHVVPLSRGGKTVDTNLVTSCYPCNFSKFGFTLDQLGLDDPRDRPPIVDDWDGLGLMLQALKKRAIA